MSTAGARHLAESEAWLAAQREPIQEPEPEPAIEAATAPLIEVVCEHERRQFGADVAISSMVALLHNALYED